MTTASFREQLKAVKPAVKVATQKIGNLPDSANAWVKDGLDHINIARQSATNIGKTLNLDYIRNWEHSVLGPFRCINSLWYFLRAKHRTDAIRSLAGPELRRFVDTRCDGFGGHLPNFRIMILDSMYKRVKSCHDIAAEIVRTVLPFDSYRENESGIRIRFEHTPWIAAGYEEIRSALKENRAPDFTDIAGRIEGEMADIYKPILKQLVREPTEAEILELTAAKKAEEKKLKKQNSKKHNQPREVPKAKHQRVDLAAIQNIDDDTLDTVINGNVAPVIATPFTPVDDDGTRPIVSAAFAAASVSAAAAVVSEVDSKVNLVNTLDEDVIVPGDDSNEVDGNVDVSTKGQDAITVNDQNYTLSEIQPQVVIGIDPSIGEDSTAHVDSIATMALPQETVAIVSTTTAVTDAAAA